MPGLVWAARSVPSCPGRMEAKMDVYNLIILLILLAFIVWSYGRGRWF